MALVDSTGVVQNRYAYDPWDNAIVGGTTGSAPNPFRYAGAMLDNSTGLYKMGERYYDPSIGRFTQEDPAGGGYSYVDANPVNFVDPGGLGKHHKKAKKHKTSKESTPHKAVRLVIDVLAVLPYGPYNLSENALVTLNKAGSHYGKPGQVIAYVVGAPFVPPEAAGLSTDIGIDWIKGHALGNESIHDEMIVAPINTFHSFLPKALQGPQIYLPGLGVHGIDWQW